jgi:hypothetical protein
MKTRMIVLLSCLTVVLMAYVALLPMPAPLSKAAIAEQIE